MTIYAPQVANYIIYGPRDDANPAPAGVYQFPNKEAFEKAFAEKRNDSRFLQNVMQALAQLMDNKSYLFRLAFKRALGDAYDLAKGEIKGSVPDLTAPFVASILSLGASIAAGTVLTPSVLAQMACLAWGGERILTSKAIKNNVLSRLQNISSAEGRVGAAIYERRQEVFNLAFTATLGLESAVGKQQVLKSITLEPNLYACLSNFIHSSSMRNLLTVENTDMLSEIMQASFKEIEGRPNSSSVEKEGAKIIASLAATIGLQVVTAGRMSATSLIVPPFLIYGLISYLSASVGRLAKSTDQLLELATLSLKIKVIGESLRGGRSAVANNTQTSAAALQNQGAFAQPAERRGDRNEVVTANARGLGSVV
jgi:hypothetical protein